MNMNKNVKQESSVITIRIDKGLDKTINKLKNRLGLTKADLIRNYLDMARFLIKEKNSLKSYNNRDFIIVKRSYLTNIINDLEEKEQILRGDNLARFVNDIARINGKYDDINYKLELCDNFGFFQKFIDEEDFVLVTKKFGPKKFVESFLYRLFTENEMDQNYTEEKLKNNKSLNSKYSKQFIPIERSASHYTYKFMELSPEG